MKPETVKLMSVEEALEMNERLKSENLADGSASTKHDTKAKDGDTKADKSGGKTEENEPGSDAKSQVSGRVVDAKSGRGVKTEKKALIRSQSKQSRSVNLMQQCINSFKEFFHTLVSVKFLKNDSDLQRYFQQVLTDNSSCENGYSRARYAGSCPDGAGKSAECFDKLDLSGCKEDCLKTFSLVCDLLVEFASFPMCGQHGKVDRYGSSGRLLHGLCFCPFYSVFFISR